jgi:hypothetical protein
VGRAYKAGSSLTVRLAWYEPTCVGSGPVSGGVCPVRDAPMNVYECFYTRSSRDESVSSTSGRKVSRSGSF